MPRRVEDIVRSDRRSIRDIPQEKSSASEKRSAKFERPKEPVKEEKPREVSLHKLKVTAPIHVGNAGKAPVNHAKRKAVRAKIWWAAATFVVVTVVIITGYIASIYFSRATFTIAAVTMPVPVDTTIVATATSSAGYLSYKTITVNGNAQVAVPATTGIFSAAKAKGSITIYDSYSKDPQRLNAGTRLSSDSTGLIYRLTGSVVVPGYKTSPTGTIIPGSLTVPVIADQNGDEYNISKSEGTTFKVVGYLGTPRYGSFMGKIATNITGGFSGQKKTVDKTLLASTTESLQAALTTELLAKAKSLVPDGYIMYDSAYKASFPPVALSGTSTNSATVIQKGTLYGIVFSRNDLTVKLAGAEKVNSFNTFPYRAPGLESLSFTITNSKDFSPATQNTLIAKVKGDMTLIGIVPVDVLKHKLAGLPLGETSAVLKSYSPVIDVAKSTGELFPSWSMSVPKDESRISVVVKQ
jgi:hypothetical protein